MRALVTGGIGFIGTNLSNRLLCDGHEVILFDKISRVGVRQNLDWLKSQHRSRMQFIEGDVYHNVVAGFQVWWVSVWYILSVSLLGLHLRHGIWSMFQSVGFNHPRHTPILKGAAAVIAVVIVLGYISIPISVLLGIVK